MALIAAFFSLSFFSSASYHPLPVFRPLFVDLPVLSCVPLLPYPPLRLHVGSPVLSRFACGGPMWAGSGDRSEFTSIDESCLIPLNLAAFSCCFFLLLFSSSFTCPLLIAARVVLSYLDPDPWWQLNTKPCPPAWPKRELRFE